MFVYEILSCEEHAWQVSHGLYASREKAVEVARVLCRKEVEDRGREVTNVSTIEIVGDELTLVLLGMWDEKSFNEWLDKQDHYYWWYNEPFKHVGVFSVQRVEVKE